MTKQYTKQTKNTQKQPKKQQQSGAVSKLKRSHFERGFREANPNKNYYAILSNGRVEDYTTNSPIFARLHFNEIASVLGLQVKSVHAYKQ